MLSVLYIEWWKREFTVVVRSWKEERFYFEKWKFNCLRFCRKI
jgi:hypothetical protein